jgi:hypothetical protein
MPDAAKRESLLSVIKSQPEYKDGRALVSVAEFFDGNDDLGSIGCNLAEHPSLAHFKNTLESIKNRNDVDEIWLQIYDLEEGEWPFSENVLIFGNVSELEIQQLSESLQPSEISKLNMEWVPSRATYLAGRKYLNLWWD